MELARRYLPWLSRFHIPRRIPKLPKISFAVPANPLARFRSKKTSWLRLKALGFIALGVFVALQAHSISGRESLRQWLGSNPPLARVWKHCLESFGFIPIKNPAQIHKVLRTLPVMSVPEDKSLAWVTADLAWIAVFQSTDANSENTLVYSRGSPALPKAESWTPLESGWPGYIELAGRLEKTAIPRTPQKPARRRVGMGFDSRQVQY